MSSGNGSTGVFFFFWQCFPNGCQSNSFCHRFVVWFIIIYILAGGNSVICDFQYDTCGWTQDRTDSFDWTRRKGPTSSSNTGPSGDHTTQSRSRIKIFFTLSHIITLCCDSKKENKKNCWLLFCCLQPGIYVAESVQ